MIAVPQLRLGLPSNCPFPFHGETKPLKLIRVNAVDRNDTRVIQLCDDILRHPQVAIASGKRLFYAQLEKDLAGAYAQAAEVMACNMMEQDTLDGISAFLDKRPPPWQSDADDRAPEH